MSDRRKASGGGTAAPRVPQPRRGAAPEGSFTAPAVPGVAALDPEPLSRLRERLLEAALWLAAGEPRERVAEGLLACLDELDRLVPPGDDVQP